MSPYNAMNAPCDLTIKNNAATLNNITATGPAQINENSTAQYACRAYYSDGTNADVTASASWSDNGSPYVDISSSGVLTALDVAADQACTVTATYQGKTSNLGISIKDLPPPAPTAPILAAPADGAKVNSAAIRLTWNAVSGATGYALTLKDNVTNAVVVNDWGIPAATTYRDCVLPKMGAYRWSVAAKNGTSNWGSFSTTRTFSYTSPANNTQTNKNQANSVEPVNTSSGAYLYSHQDLTIPARGLPFEFARFYSSKAEEVSVQMAPKWRHTYQVSLLENPGDGTVVIHWANCTEDYLTPLGGGQYKNTYFGYSGKLTKNGDNTFDFVTKTLVKYHFDSAGSLLAISDRNDNALTMVYTAGALSAVRDAAGRQLLFEYTAGRLTKVTDFAETPRYIEFAYEANGDLKTFTDVLRHPMQYSYDSAFPEAHCLKTIADRRGNTIVTNVYTDINSDPSATDLRVTHQTNGRGNIWDYSYDPAAGITTETDPQQPTRGVTTYQYDEHSWLVKKTDPKGNYVQYTYDADGNRTVLDNARRKTTTSTFDAHGNVLTVTDALNDVTTFEYNVNDQVTLIKDAKGRETRSEYDARWNLVAVRRPMNHVTQYAYDAYGQLLTVTDAMGRVTTHAYDAAGKGNRISTTNALGQTTQFAYDAVGRLTDIIEPLVPPATTPASTHFDYWDDDAVKNIR